MTLTDLIEALKECPGPSRTLDFWLSARVYNPSQHTDGELQDDIDAVGIENMCIDAPFTRAVDAAISLAEKVLPGWQINVHKYTNTLTEASVGARGEFPAVKASGPAIALCIAILSALQAKEGMK